MAIHYTEETIHEIFSSDEFLDSIQEYENNKSNQELLKFLNSITTNSQYFRLGITRKKKFNKSPSNTCNDTDIVNLLCAASYWAKCTSNIYINP